MNERYTTAPLKALSTSASLNSRYMHANAPGHHPVDKSSLSPPASFEGGSFHAPITQEAPKSHQDIMLEINEEIQGMSDSRYSRVSNQVNLQPLASGNSPQNVAAKRGKSQNCIQNPLRKVLSYALLCEVYAIIIVCCWKALYLVLDS